MSRALFLFGAFLKFSFALCAVSFAADLSPWPSPSSAAPSFTSWTGFYLGVGGGISSLNSKIGAQPGPDPSSPGISASLNGLGAIGTLATAYAGYDYQLSPLFLVGVFGDYDFHVLKSTLDINVATIPLTAHGEISASHQWSAGGRVGYLTSPTSLVFLEGGYTSLALSNFTVGAGGPFPTMALVASVPKIAGVFAGAGFETKLTKLLSFRGEYRLTTFGSGIVTLPTLDGTNVNDFITARISPTLQSARASVVYRF